VEFLDKRFTLQNALVTFTGPATTPQLQIDAVYFIDRSVAEQLDEPRDGKARVVIRIDGTPSDPKLKLISDPSLTDTEILYILATGRPPQTAEVGQDQGVVSAALGAASGLALAMLQDSLSIKIPLDVIRLEGGTGGQAIGGFEVGKYLTPDLFVSYRQRFSSSEQASESILGIEYQFASKWKFETTLSTNSAASFNIFRDLL
jgi:translocation and assembly module TamB